MFFGYNLKLDKRTLKLEKKNGHEQHQIDEIKTRMQRLETKLSKDQKNFSEREKKKTNTLPYRKKY
jgi:tRNA(Phe) wybutosine-synthesizing methylase Tyw3